ncbi:hypothetical protein B0H16DRAFT_1549981 [Mycena metata]|uniref:Uncharacterized protein n=1 Tax=Mycena metata TaxID=1033252 RepID=A0AAD7IWK4_9AGAR|nr:hypothetical protein B0H16DRAFT_1549981 [Mycena metata]
MSTPAAGASASTSSTPPTSGQAPPPPPPPPSAAKRNYDSAIATLGEIRRPKSKRAKRNPLETKSSLEKLMSMARYFPRAVHPFMDIGLALEYGGKARWSAPTPAAPGNSVVIPASQQKEEQTYIDAFERMIAVSSECADVLREFYKDEDQWTRIISKFRETANSARHNDTTGLKHKLKYPTPIVPAIPEATSKSDRGVNHAMLRDAIIPWSLRLKIHERAPTSHDGDASSSSSPTAGTSEEEALLSDEAKRALSALLNGCKETDGVTPALTSGRFPSCFYADGTYDSNDPAIGLFRAPFLLRIGRHLWTTPSSAMDGATSLKTISNARAHGQFIVTREMIGYICCHGRNMLSTADWAVKDGAYNYQKLFNKVVKLFKKDNDPWVVDTLKWYQDGIFGQCRNASTEDRDSDNDDDDEDDDVAIINARRAERESSASSG